MDPFADGQIQCNQCVDFDATNDSVHDSIFEKTILGSEKPKDVIEALKRPTLWSPQRQPLKVHSTNNTNTEIREHPTVKKDSTKRTDDTNFKIPPPAKIPVRENEAPPITQKIPTSPESHVVHTEIPQQVKPVDLPPDVKPKSRIADKSLTPTVKRMSYSKPTNSSHNKENPVKMKSLLHSKSISTLPVPRSSISSTVKNLPPQPRERTNSTGSNSSRGSSNKINLERIMSATKSSSLRARSASGQPLPECSTMRARSSSTGSRPNTPQNNQPTGHLKRTSSTSMRTRTSSSGSTGSAGSEKKTIKITRSSLENLARPRTASVGAKSSDQIALEKADAEKKQLSRLRNKNMTALQNLKLSVPLRQNKDQNTSVSSVTSTCSNEEKPKMRSIYQRTPQSAEKPSSSLKGLPPRQPAHVTHPKPFDFLIDKRGEIQQQKFKQMVEEEERQARESALHHARPADVLKRKPYMTKPSEKQPTAPLNIQLYSQERAQERKKLDEKMAVIEAQKAEILAQRQKIQEEMDREEMRKLRQATVMKPEPIHKYKPVVIHKSERPLTVPQSPSFQPKKRLNSAGSQDDVNQTDC